MAISHCTIGYHQFGTSALDTFANQVYNGIFNNPTTFPSPVIDKVVFEDFQHNFSIAAADYALYGATKKTIFTKAKKKLIDALDLLADYVDTTANGDEAIIIASGYTPSITTPQGNIPLTRIEMFIAKRTENEGEIYVEIPPITGHGSINYFCICSEGEPLANPTFVEGKLVLENNANKIRYDLSKSRKKYFKGLMVTTMYYFYVFASNTVSVAPLSNPKNVIAA
ncbi:hypothetical protein [Flavobacterium aciduliphilum]|uniref:Uncharacterized protein n=1 Tax=Flavobacterium aciduliphilum TaxID=1101402 RepID=A0A328YMF5_9FLAO|nr:hypothetical protein [Flavobacterium aciduliphilum]RAR75308.1 hypothetical protein CLV55_1013 [Flavobacterium aciduliphilum]